MATLSNTCDFPSSETPITISGPVGALEAIIVGPAQGEIKQIAIVCHPHPLYGGTMNNKVVTTLVRVLRNLQCAVIRFNFRGIGKSEGTYGDTKGEVDDLLAVIDWTEKKCSQFPLWLAGFSFGGFIAAKVAEQKSVDKLIIVAPPVNHFPFQNLQFRSPTWIVQGERDEIVPAEEVYVWREKFFPKANLIILPGATHFFHGQLKQLQLELEKVLGI